MSPTNTELFDLMSPTHTGLFPLQVDSFILLLDFNSANFTFGLPIFGPHIFPQGSCRKSFCKMVYDIWRVGTEKIETLLFMSG